MLFAHTNQLTVYGTQTWTTLWDGYGIVEFDFFQASFDKYTTLGSLSIYLAIMGFVLQIDIKIGEEDKDF